MPVHHNVVFIVDITELGDPLMSTVMTWEYDRTYLFLFHETYYPSEHTVFHEVDGLWRNRSALSPKELRLSCCRKSMITYTGLPEGAFV